ncbi:hypothetical protein [Rhodococcus sp. YH1]|uniref:hypothetical protein n=1 Tax=Rhodococcus sp. YH1 TaxID=89066 RepID=UPI001386F1D6|nr:hypothetical protein [Rhodococcus sp. YH1]NCL78915.1 hypothetical protein [Rhodococcus sp. YH1]
MTENAPHPGLSGFRLPPATAPAPAEEAPDAPPQDTGPSVAALIQTRRDRRAGRYDPDAVDEHGLPTVGALIARTAIARSTRNA